MTYAIIDLIFLLLIVFFAIVATVKGFITELFEKGAPIIAVWVAILTYKFLSESIYKFVKVEWASVIIAFIAIFILVFLIVKIIQKIVWEVFNKEVFTQLDRLLGFFLGLAEGFAIVILILCVLKVQPFFDVTKLLEGSFFDRIFSFFTEPNVKKISEKTFAIVSGAYFNV